MSTDNILVVLGKAGTQLNNYAVVTAAGLKQLAELNPSPYVKFREEQQDLVWEGPAEEFAKFFHTAAARKDADEAIKRAMRRG